MSSGDLVAYASWAGLVFLAVLGTALELGRWSENSRVRKERAAEADADKRRWKPAP